MGLPVPVLHIYQEQVTYVGILGPYLVGVHDTNKPTMGNGTRQQGGGRRSKLTMVE